jgi:hypothetical protein
MISIRGTMGFFSFICRKLTAMKKESIQIKFEGQNHQIDANTLICALMHYNTLITESNKEFGGGSKQVNVKINAIEKGSFVVDIEIVESFLDVFSGENIAYLAGVTTLAGFVLQLYHRKKGAPAKEKEIENELKIDIKGNKNHVTINQVIKVYNNRVVREAISKSIEAANEDSSVEAITFTGKKIVTTTFSKQDFPELIYTDFDGEIGRVDEKDEYVNATLIITGLNFESGGRWQFIYNGFRIPMIVKDGVLMQQIANGERFGKGDALKVKMKITKKFNTTYNTYENKSYKIVEFYEHIIHPKPEQGSIDWTEQ